MIIMMVTMMIMMMMMVMTMMMMMMIEDARWKGEEDVDEETLAIYKQLELRDRRRLSTIKTDFRQFLENLNVTSDRWTVADRNKNLQLSKEEFAAFIHPEA